ncbi:hypothetical protein NLJ89_g7526 [Agrocybe chaxingu]|uniref:Uncharacterized protein n=1 Tax=Agrocybe chaxingu TaxID=84603 RepID=A0A9W8MRN7_9AGAR|nr:hypothetical protein NLJ89_g7526 [Agrocybe chaxingu]
MDEDVAMMDVDGQETPTSTSNSQWVAPPASPQDLSSVWTAENSTQQRIIQFITRWPPSRTPFAYGPWIYASRGGMSEGIAGQDIPGLKAAFQALLGAGRVTVDTVDQISKTNNVVTGKWMIFEESPKIDMLWGKILHFVTVERKKGVVKVSTCKEGEKHVICIYVNDYTNKPEVDALRKGLRSLGVKWRIGFKTDAYTHLNIYKDNPWNLRPSRFQE